MSGLPAPASVLPHRPPFLFVDELVEVVPGESAHGAWRLTGDEAFFAGHFPDYPVVPGARGLSADDWREHDAALTEGHLELTFGGYLVEPGDELRYVDWKILGRNDRLYVKQFEEETNLRAVIVFDTSRSMAWTGSPFSKRVPMMPIEVSPVVGLALPPMKPVIRMPRPRSFMISATERVPGGTTRLEGLPVVGSQPSLRL